MHLFSIGVRALTVVGVLGTATLGVALSGASPANALAVVNGMADEPDGAGTREKRGEPRMAPQRLIVKFRSEGPNRMTMSAHWLLDAPANPRDVPPEVARYSSLITLSRECGLEEIRGLFVERKGVDTAEAEEQQRRLVEAVRRKFPARARRASIDGGRGFPHLGNYYVMEFKEGQSLERARRRFRDNPFVESVDFDFVAQADAEPRAEAELAVAFDDPFLGTRGSWQQVEDDLWGLKQVGCVEAWETSKGRGVVVAVVDTGLDFDHPDIVGNFWVNAGEVAGNGVDDDANGFVDDVRGWDFVNQGNNPRDDSVVGHGTHVAGTIAAVGGNHEGIVGVAPESKVMVVKAGNVGGELELSNGARALQYAVANGADVINCSWGPGIGGLISTALEDVVRFAHGMGVVVVFASGNDSTTGEDQSPMNLLEVLTVGASNPEDNRLSKSNWGRYQDLLAPGGSADVVQRNVFGLSAPILEPRRSILSLKSSGSTTVPRALQFVVGERYQRLSGTSMAAPQVSGAVALVLAVNPDLTNDDVMAMLKASARDVLTTGFDVRSGYGRLDAAAAAAVARHKPPSARLTSPVENQELPVDGGTVGISGVVRGERLREHQLLLSPLDNLEDVRPLTEARTGNIEGELFAWDTSSLAPGSYLLRLAATDVGGNRFEDLVRVFKSPRGIVPIEGVLNMPELANAASNRYVAWVQQDISPETGEATHSILALDRQTGQRTTVLTTPVDPQPIAVSDRLVAHYSERGNGVIEILVRDIELKSAETLTDPHLRPLTIGLTDQRMIYEEEGGRPYVVDLDSFRVTRLNGRDPGDKSDVDGDRAVWLTGLQNVAVCDLATGRIRLLTENGHAVLKDEPRISGDVVVWIEHEASEVNQIFRLVAYDLRTDRKREFVQDRPLVKDLQICGKIVVWCDARTGNPDIYLYDLESNQERRLSSSPDAEMYPKLAENSVVWTRIRRGTEDGEVKYVPTLEQLELGSDVPR